MILGLCFPFAVLALASAACVVFFTSVPAEAACPAGYYQCVGGGKAHSPKRCCPTSVRTSSRPAALPPIPLSRCKTAVRQVGPNNSVKIRCTSWSSLPGVPGAADLM